MTAMGIIKINARDKINHLGRTLYRVVNEVTGKKGGWVSKEVVISDDSWVEYEGAVISGNGGKIFLTNGTKIEGKLESHSQVTKVSNCFFRGEVVVEEPEIYTAEFVNCKTIDKGCKIFIANPNFDVPVQFSDNVYLENVLMSSGSEMYLSPHGSVSRATLFSRAYLSVDKSGKYLISDLTIGERGSLFISGFARVGTSNLTMETPSDGVSFKDIDIKCHSKYNYMSNCLINNTRFEVDDKYAEIIRVDNPDIDLIINDGVRYNK